MIECRHTIWYVWILCFGFIDFMLKGKSLLGYTKLFSSNDYEKNDKIMLKYFQSLKRWKKLFCIICGKYRASEKLKTSLVISVNCSKCKNKDDKLFKKKESIEILKSLGLIENVNSFKNMTAENISQKFRSNNIDEIGNYFLEEIKHNELISEKHKKICTTLNYFEHS